MSKYRILRPETITLFIFVLLLNACNSQSETVLQSPDKNITIQFSLNESGSPVYEVLYGDDAVILPSHMGYEFRDRDPLRSGLQILSVNRVRNDEIWEQPWGESGEVRNHYNEMEMLFGESESPDRTMIIRFRAFNDGVAFRYEVEPAAGTDSLFVTGEMTQFRLAGDHDTWWIPADYDSYEYVYDKTKVSEIDASKYSDENERPDRRIDNFHAVNTPVTMKTGSGIYLSFHEAALTDYPGMTLAVRDNLVLESELVPWADGIKVKKGNSFTSPWRTIQIADRAGALAESTMILNLNEPSRIEDTSWIEPMTYAGIWWEMHIGKTSWGMGELAEGSFGEIGGRSNHGATTENAFRYIDFASGAGIQGLLIEGWNTGWEYWGTDSLGFFDFTTSYPDFDLEKVVSYGNEKGVKIIGHHETSGQAQPYEERLEPAFQLYSQLGINAVKTGYAGAIVPDGETHHGQWMVRHYRKVVETAAKYQIAINAHEPIKATGIRRTWPNMMTREGVRGMEYNAWSNGNPPEHTTILPFTRGLAGPTDYTPGIFDLLFDEYRKEERVHSTLANQLAIYVVLFSPHQMAADLPENYYTSDGEFHPAFQFIRDVPTDWEKSIVPEAEIGEFVVVVRKEKGTDNWYAGAVTNEEARSLELDVSFLDADKTYRAVIYQDGEDAHWEHAPHEFDITEMDVDRSSTIQLNLAAGGGAAIQIKSVD